MNLIKYCSAIALIVAAVACGKSTAIEEAHAG